MILTSAQNAHRKLDNNKMKSSNLTFSPHQKILKSLVMINAMYGK